MYILQTDIIPAFSDTCLVARASLTRALLSIIIAYYQDQLEDPHKPPPSPVVHVRGLPDSVLEADLVSAVQHFGPIRYSTYNIPPTLPTTCTYIHYSLSKEKKS